MKVFAKNLRQMEFQHKLFTAIGFSYISVMTYYNIVTYYDFNKFTHVLDRRNKQLGKSVEKLQRSTEELEKTCQNTLLETNKLNDINEKAKKDMSEILLKEPFE